MELYLRYKRKINQEGRTNKTSEGLMALTFYLDFYGMHLKYGLLFVAKYGLQIVLLFKSYKP